MSLQPGWMDRLTVMVYMTVIANRSGTGQRAWRKDSDSRQYYIIKRKWPSNSLRENVLVVFIREDELGSRRVTEMTNRVS